MERTPLVEKYIAIGIILLFVGVAIAPTINFNTVKASQDDDLVEVTTQACGIKGFGDTTVKLTREQYQNLEQYLVEFRARLNQTSTREEAVPIFKEAAVELNKYGLLPRGMSVEKAQGLMMNANQNVEERDITHSTNPYRQNTTIDNAFCLVFGEHMEVLFERILPFQFLLFLLIVGMYSSEIIYKLGLYSLAFILLYIAACSEVLLIGLGLLLFIRLFLIPINIGVSLSLYSETGHLVTVGLLGRKSWDGYFVSGFTKLPAGLFGHYGIIGFTGIHLSILKGPYGPFYSTFLGSALAVNIMQP